MVARHLAVLWTSALACAVGVAPGSALASGSFGLSPMRVELSVAVPTAVLTLSNPGDAPVSLQIQARAWTQVDGQDQQAPTSDLIFNPAAATIPPGGEQIVRVALRKAPDRERERAYRLLLREVPTAAAAVDAPVIGLKLAMAMDVPMFVAPLVASPVPPPELSLQMAGDGQVRLRIANPGQRHLRLSDVRLTQGDATVVEQSVFVVLPGAARELLLVPPLRRGSLQFKAQSDAGPLDLTLEFAVSR